MYSGEELSSNRNSYDLRHHEHTFTTTKEPTCTEPGEKVSSGCICGQTVTETIPALGHDWGEWKVTKEAGPGVKGEETRVCARDASHIETRPIPALPVEPTNPTNPTDPTDPTNPTNPTNPTDPTDPTDPTNPTNPTDPTDPTDPINPTDPTVEIDVPNVPLGDLPEVPDEAVEIDAPDVPLAELPGVPEGTVEIDAPAVPLGDVPQTGEASTAMWLAVLLACGMGLVYVNTGKRKENA